jgi:hypothetical protein
MTLSIEKVHKRLQKLGITWENSQNKIVVLDATQTNRTDPFMIQRFGPPPEGAGADPDVLYPEVLWIFTNVEDLRAYNDNPESYFPKEIDGEEGNE